METVRYLQRKISCVDIRDSPITVVTQEGYGNDIQNLLKQQEPRLLSQYSHDDNMIGAYKQGKDLYATIASKIYHNDYWDNMEKTKDGVDFPEGKKRRKSVKSLMLGIMYGMGTASLASSIGCDIKEAQKIIDDFYDEFPNVKNWIDNTCANARKSGYVEDFWGRRRRLPDIQLPKYSINPKKNETHFNPLLRTSGVNYNGSMPKIEKYKNMLSACRDYRTYNTIKGNASKEGIEIKDNGGFISRAERQCVNARVQGGAATMSKRAMLKVYRDDELKDLGFRLMLAVHDELIGECPKENADKVANRLCEIMRGSALPEVQVPFKCDPSVERVWYETEYSDEVKVAYDKLLSKMTQEKALNNIYDMYCECEPSRLNRYLGVD